MSVLVSVRWRIFLVAWILYSLHFATNVVREHYPAFAVVDHATFRVDEYQGFHSDIFVHRDGHSVIGNQVLVSVLAAVPLFIFDPVLDALEPTARRGCRPPANASGRIPHRQADAARVLPARSRPRPRPALRRGDGRDVGVLHGADRGALSRVLSSAWCDGPRRGGAPGRGADVPARLRHARCSSARRRSTTTCSSTYAMFVSFALLWSSAEGSRSAGDPAAAAGGTSSPASRWRPTMSAVMLMPLLWAYCVVVAPAHHDLVATRSGNRGAWSSAACRRSPSCSTASGRCTAIRSCPASTGCRTRTST